LRERHPITAPEAEIASPAPAGDTSPRVARADGMPMLITDPRQPDNPIVYVNDAFSRLTGYGREEVLGRNCRFLQGPETDRSAVERVKDAIRRRIPIELDLRNHRKDGTLFWNRIYLAPVFDADGELTHFFASQFDVTRERDRPSIIQRIATVFGLKPGGSSA
jgi:PAS domain S-box-containing protein